MKKNLINRELYKIIKKMDHNQMENFCQNLYMNGYKDGIKKAESEAVTPEELGLALSQIKGIGDKKVAVILETVNSLKKQ